MSSGYLLVRLQGEQGMRDAGLLRASAYVTRGWASVDDLDSAGCEVDEFDIHALHFGVYEAGVKLVGYVRMIERESAGRLPVELHFPGLWVQSASVEISRLVVHEGVRDPLTRARIVLALVRAMTSESVRRGIEAAYATLEIPLLRKLQALGVNFEPVTAETRLDRYQSDNVAVRIAPLEVSRGIWRKETAQLNGGRPTQVDGLAGYGWFFDEAIRTGRYEGPISPDMRELGSSAVSRNLGFLSAEEQSSIQRATVAIAGTGGDGGALALGLARMGVRSFRLADPEVFEVENLNRQKGSSLETVGRNKAVVVAEELLRVNPAAHIRVYSQGVTVDNVDEFVSGSDLVIDETEFTTAHVGVLLARAARRHSLSVLMAFNVGFGAYVTSFAPEGMTLERRLGIRDDLPLEQVGLLRFGLERWVGVIPSYSDMSVLAEIARGDSVVPSVAPGVLMAASIGTTEALLHLIHRRHVDTRRPRPHVAPRALAVDPFMGSSEVRLPRVHYLRTLAIAAMRWRLGVNTHAGLRTP